MNVFGRSAGGEGVTAVMAKTELFYFFVDGVSANDVLRDVRTYGKKV